MMKDSGLPAVPHLPYAVQYARHVRNLTLSTGRDSTPHFAMFGTTIDVLRIRVFACAAWVFIPHSMHAKGKLADRSVRGVFVGLGLPLENPAY